MTKSLPWSRLAASLITLAALRAMAADAAFAARFAQQAIAAGDTAGLAIAVVDKPSATIWVFDARGQPLASSPVLVGQATGDVAPPGIGSRPLSRVRPSEKITNAGRYLTEPGVNTQGEDIVWLDYDDALSMHRVRHVRGENRPHRLATPTVADNRISFGCINMPPAFYEQYIAPLFGDMPGVVYVLPEQSPSNTFFPFAR